jgi:F-type H+-transporting ATPase subunit a
LSPIAASADGFEAPGVADFWQPLFGTDGAFAITRPAIVLTLSVVLIAAVLLRATRRLSVVPGRGQLITESVYAFVRNSVARDVIGSREFLRFVPLLFTLFTLILVNNVFAIIPVIQYPTMSRVAFPAALTIFVFVLYHYLGIRKHGLGGYFKSLVPPGLPTPLIPYIFVLELITYFFTRPVTLALRLFGNMFAGHLLLLLFVTGAQYMIFDSGSPVLGVFGVFSYGAGFVMTIFEILVEVLQAYIFTLLTALYIAGALADEH